LWGEIIPPFSKIQRLFDDYQFRHLLRDSFSSPSSLYILFVTFYDVFVRFIYFRLEARFKHDKLFRNFQFGAECELLNLINRAKSDAIDPLIWGCLNTHEIRLSSSKARQFFKIKLASGYVLYHVEIFNRIFEDDEDTFSVHRFKWLLILLADCPTQEAVDLGYDAIETWIEKFQTVSTPKVFESYSISERLINFLFFVIFTKKYSKKKDVFWRQLCHSYEIQIGHLLLNLEYHWRYTNNHILNNARCLYICGSLLGIKNAKKIGQKILTSQTDKMIKYGILQEDSGHYQMLLTRSYLEILYTAHMVEDNEMIAWIQPRVSQMLCVCNSLQSKFQSEEYPLFGDISPDIFPEWILGRPFSQNNSEVSTWQKLFRINRSIMPIHKKQSIGRQFNRDINNKWYYLSKGKFEVWVIAKTRSASISHGHADNGSFVIFYNGKPIFIDLGRYRYNKKDAESIFHLSQEAHHIPMIDNSLFDYCRNEWFNSNRFGSKCDVIGLMDESIEYEIVSLDNKIKLRRKVILHDDAIMIVDTVENISSKKGSIKYTHDWYTSKKCDLIANKILIRLIYNSLEFSVQTMQPVRLFISRAPRAVRYGEIEQIFRLSMSEKILFDQKVTTIIREQITHV